MIQRILVQSDFLYTQGYSETYSDRWSIELMRYQIEQATGVNVEYLKFDRDAFFRLSNIDASTKEPFAVSSITAASMEMLKKLIATENTLFIGAGLSVQTRELLNIIGVTFINYWNHPVHYLDDLFFAWNTNDKCIHNKLLEYAIDDRLFTLYANYFKIKLMWHIDEHNNPLCNNSALFIGQSMNDKSVEKDGKFLNITDFVSNINDLKRYYTMLYYAPHPKHKFNREVNNFIKQNSDFIKVIENHGTYELLANPRIKKVIGISSSVLYEAIFWGKSIEYLFKPFGEFCNEFDFLNNFVGIYGDNYSISFWQNVLSPIMSVTNAQDLNYLTLTNRVRDLRPASLYWGYKDLDKFQKHIDMLEDNKLKQEITKGKWHKWFVNILACFIKGAENRCKFRKRDV